MGKPFPRAKDDLPHAWGPEGGRFTPEYEQRAERLWDVLVELGLRPELVWAGSEDGEAIVAYPADDSDIAWLLHLEDPESQKTADRHLADGDAAAWIRSSLAV